MKKSLKETKKTSLKKNKDKKDQTYNSLKEVNGRGGLDPTRYGDWEKNGRCIDF